MVNIVYCLADCCTWKDGFKCGQLGTLTAMLPVQSADVQAAVSNWDFDLLYQGYCGNILISRTSIDLSLIYLELQHMLDFHLK